ncbi:MAG: DUF134 domain-containing protein [Ruminococcus sp.]|nr:DUF134 domain-containing protein [Ruminococcus sp.]
MARPCSVRRVCKAPEQHILAFENDNKGTSKEPLRLTIDEYETVRLIDLVGVSQAECARRMGIARTTAQMIYAHAREKLARCLVNGEKLSVEGGNYYECDGSAGCPECGNKD